MSHLGKETQDLLGPVSARDDEAIELRRQTRQCLVDAERHLFQLELSLHSQRAKQIE